MNFVAVRERVLGTSWGYKLLFASVCALATAYGAQMKIFLPWTPVPITMQTLFVLLSGILLGRFWGLCSQLIYVAAGVLGIPFFAHMSGGLAILIGPRGGYLFGFMLTAFVVGHVVERCTSWKKMFFMLSLVYVLCVYLPGCLHLACWLLYIKGSVSVWHVLTMGCFPFLIGDVIKVCVATVVGRAYVWKK